VGKEYGNAAPVPPTNSRLISDAEFAKDRGDCGDGGAPIESSPAGLYRRYRAR